MLTRTIASTSHDMRSSAQQPSASGVDSKLSPNKSSDARHSLFS